MPSAPLRDFLPRPEPAISITFCLACWSGVDFDPNSTMKKRLHVAGLAPGVSASDLTQRLGTFGTVIVVDSAGTVDGLGRPRLVTFEVKGTQLARCMCPLLAQFRSDPRATGMNLSSGTAWKRAKLRVGEAKPGFCKRHRSSYLYGLLQTNRFLLCPLG